MNRSYKFRGCIIAPKSTGGYEVTYNGSPLLEAKTIKGAKKEILNILGTVEAQ